MNNGSSWLHFNWYRLKEYLNFYSHYIICKLFHEQDTAWQSWKGAMLCNCGVGIDLGYSYGQHCEDCYNRVLTEQGVKK